MRAFLKPETAVFDITAGIDCMTLQDAYLQALESEASEAEQNGDHERAKQLRSQIAMYRHASNSNG